MRSGAFWITGLILLFFAFSALEFRSLETAQRAMTQQYGKLNEAVQSMLETGHGARPRSAGGQAGVSEKSLEGLSLDLQNFMRDMRSRQTGYDRRLADLDDRLNHEREGILSDLKTFLEDMRAERQEFTKEFQAARTQGVGAESSEGKKISDLLEKIDEKIKELGQMVEKESKRREEIYKQETEGVKIEGTISGPGSDTRKSYP